MLRLTIALTLILAAPAAARPGDLDRSFASGGRIAFAGGPGYTSAGDVALRADGRLLVGGSGQQRRAPNTWVGGSTLARLSSSGRIESRAFVTAPTNDPFYFNPATEHVVALPDGGALVASTLGFQTNFARIAVYRLRADGTPDPSFGTGGAAVVDSMAPLYLAGLGVDGAGRILVAGSASNDATVVIRLLPSGAPDGGYAPGRLTGASGALLVEPDGGAVVATVRTETGQRARAALYRLDANGRRTGSAARLLLRDRTDYQTSVRALARGPRGTVLVAGNDYDHRHSFGWLARVRPDDRLDRGFGRRGRAVLAIPHRDVFFADIARDRRGRIVLAGAIGQYEADQALVARWTPGGRLDRRFGRGGRVRKQIGARARTRLIASEARAVAIDGRGRIVVAGASYDDNTEIREDLGRSYFAVARLEG